MIKKVFKIILIALLICLVFYLINFAYKCVWYDKLLKAKKDLIASDNFTEIYKMAGRGFNEETGKNETTYSIQSSKIKDGKKVDIMYDEKEEIIGKRYYVGEKEVIHVNNKNKTFSYYISPSVPVFSKIDLTNYPILDYFEFQNGYYDLTLKEKLIYVLGGFQSIAHYKVSFINEDGKDYIVLKSGEWWCYFDKETLLASKIVIKNSPDADGGDYVNEYYEYIQGNVTDEDMTVPDLKDYTQEIYN